MTEKVDNVGNSRGRPTQRPRESPASSESAVFSPEELRCVSEEIRAAHFPAAFTTELLLMEVDPFHLHASWHVSPADLRRARNRLSRRGRRRADSDLVLRLFDVTGGARSLVQEFVVHGLDNNWYIDLKTDGRDYRAELGCGAGRGRFAHIAVSDVVRTPRAGPSPVLRYFEIMAGSGLEFAPGYDEASVPTEPERESEFGIPRAVSGGGASDPTPGIAVTNAGIPRVRPAADYAWWYSGAGPGWENCFQVEGEARR